jgi:prolyl oligopeptidase
MKGYTYPEARYSDVADDFFGTKVPDPYRWLEDASSRETSQWVGKQNELTDSVLKNDDLFDRIFKGLEGSWNFTKPFLRRRYGKRVFYFRSDGLSNQPVLYMREDGVVDDKGLAVEREVLNPNNFSEDGTRAVLVWKCSDDGTILTYSLSASGSDWQEIHIRAIDDDYINGIYDDVNELYPEILHHCRFPSISWNYNCSGFFYTRSPGPGEVPEIDRINYGKVFYHELGSCQDEDILVWEDNNDKTLNPSITTSADGNFLLISLGRTCDPKNRVWVKNIKNCYGGRLTESASDGNRVKSSRSGGSLTVSIQVVRTPKVEGFTKVVDTEDFGYLCYGSRGNTFYFANDTGAPNWRLLSLTLNDRCEGEFKEVIGESSLVFSSCAICEGGILVSYEDKACHRLFLHDFDGSLKEEISLPGPGSVPGFWGSSKAREASFCFTSYLSPLSIFELDTVSGKVEEVERSSSEFDGSPFETTQIFATSKDGTKVPMFVTCKKGLKLDGNNSVILYGYGGFGVSLNPGFSVVTSSWIENGGVYVVANLRGGGEFGRIWHEAGTKERKQNVFDDFIACGEHLIAKGYTCSDKLGIWGGSNGGLLTAACILQKPELFRAAISSVPVIDMLRFHRFTCGRYWVSDYGNGEESKEAFDYLMAYSPLHNVIKGQSYPAVLIATADTDDRVVPMHGKKFAAVMQAADDGTSPNPILLRVERKAGHGHGKPVSKCIESSAYMLTFFCKMLKLEPEIF